MPAADISVERNPATQRLADDVHAGEVERLDRVQIAVGQIGNVIDPGRGFGAAETGMIGHDHFATLRQGVEDDRPFPESVRTVQVEERCALAAAGKGELAAADLDRLPDKFHDSPPRPGTRRKR
jgi:hypothetical protein